MNYVVSVIPTPASSSINLQATLSASSAQAIEPPTPHHPITCQSNLRFHEDGSFECEHAQVPADDARTRSCIDTSIAVLLIEMLREKESHVPPW